MIEPAGRAPASTTPEKQVADDDPAELLQTEAERGDDRLGQQPREEHLHGGKISYQVGLHAEARSVRVEYIDDHRDHDRVVALSDALVELQELTERLRRECPWDREQTERTIVPHTVEEAYEVADAALAGDDAKLLDELGDLLFQSYFLALLLSERGAGDLEAVARGIHAKLVARHPHVFGDAEAATAGARARALGAAQASSRRAARASSTTCPKALPALLYARKVQRRAAVGRLRLARPRRAARRSFDEELRELAAEVAAAGAPAPETEPDPRVADELGDVLFAAVNVGAAAQRRSRARAARRDASASSRASSGPRRSPPSRRRELAELDLDEQDR